VKTRLLFFVSFVCFLNIAAQGISVDFSQPEEVAQKFLELYLKGDWYGACKFCACEGCEDQMSYMLKKMDEEGNINDESKCTFTLDKFEIEKDNVTAKYYYTKTCPGKDKLKKNHLDMKKVGDKWLIEYIYRRDKFL
jgi:hypothetical protein